ncbi:MAG: FAD:protein FMN transferase [bacterium]
MRHLRARNFPAPIRMSQSPFSPIRALRRVLVAALRRRRGRSRTRSHAFNYERVLGTSFELQVVAATLDVAKHAEAAALAEVDRLEGILSGYSATSELSRWLETHGAEVPVSAELADVLEAGEDWRIWTDGAFNPAAVSLAEMLNAADVTPLAHRLHDVNQPLWWVDRSLGNACRLTRLPISLDALAKGYIVDRVASVVADVDGITQVLVNIGGDLRHHGEHALVVGVTDPRAPAENAPHIAAVRLVGEALATSGGYRRALVMEGRTVSHILDPRTGQPADRVISASVIAPDCATADALSTAFSVLTPADSVALADSLAGIGCMIVDRDGTITSNAAWRTHSAH